MNINGRLRNACPFLLQKITILLIVFCLNSVSNALADSNSDLDKAIASKDIQKMEEALKDGANPNLVVHYFEGASDKSCIAGKWIFFAGVHGPDGDRSKSEDLTLNGLNILFNSGMDLKYCSSNAYIIPVTYGYKKVLDLLIDHGFNLTNRIYEFTPMEEVEIHENEDMINYFKSKGLKESNPDEINQIKFMRAATARYIKGMKLYLERGAKLNEPTKYGQYAIFHMLDAYSINEEALKFLISLGVDLNIREFSEKLGETYPLNLYILNSKYKYDPRNNADFQTRILELFLDHGASVFSTDQIGRTPLHVAALCDNIIAAKVLIKHGARTDVKDKANQKPSDYAKSQEMLELLKPKTYNLYLIIIAMGILGIFICLVVIIFMLKRKSG